MVVHDPSRFDYLFAPVDDPDAAATVDADVLAPPEPPVARSPRILQAVSAAVVVGAVVGVAILMWPRSADVVQTPSGYLSTTPPRPATAGVPVVVPGPQSEAPQAPSAEPTPKVTVPTVEQAPVEQGPEPSPSSAPEPPPAAAPTPIVRPPMSVSPQPRPAFPNQHSNGGSDRRGGLLGGLGGLL